MGIGVAKTEGFKGFSKFLNDILNGSDWLDELENYIHLDLLVVSPEQKGKGLGKAMMHHIFSEAKDRGKMITLETQTQENMEMYKHFGFKIHKVINHNSYTEYYMINNKYTKN